MMKITAKFWLLLWIGPGTLASLSRRSLCCLFVLWRRCWRVDREFLPQQLLIGSNRIGRRTIMNYPLTYFLSCPLWLSFTVRGRDIFDFSDVDNLPRGRTTVAPRPAPTPSAPSTPSTPDLFVEPVAEPGLFRVPIRTPSPPTDSPVAAPTIDEVLINGGGGTTHQCFDIQFWCGTSDTIVNGLSTLDNTPVINLPNPAPVRMSRRRKKKIVSVSRSSKGGKGGKGG